MKATNWHKPDNFGRVTQNLEDVHAFDAFCRDSKLKLYGLKLFGHGTYGGDKKVFFLSMDRQEAKKLIEKLSAAIERDESQEKYIQECAALAAEAEEKYIQKCVASATIRKYQYRCGSDEKNRGFYILRDNIHHGQSVRTDKWVGTCWLDANDITLPKLYFSLEEYKMAVGQCESRGAPE